ncbi:MAG: arginine repressor [Gammaproteobacteria bacterium]|nr:arginine repressor [Chromatiales bacterium]MDP7153129.1 arginine repressor [Gammaproteobacteria bacterium]
MLDNTIYIDNMRIQVFLCAFNDMPAEIETREKRQAAILRILREQTVGRQTVLVDLLQQQGIEATQSSVSRDLKQLGVMKLDQGYAPPDALPTDEERDEAIFADFIRDIQTAGANLTVIRTAIGAAQRVAVCLDRSGWPEIIGTVSGDDTIFVATGNAAGQRRLVARLQEQTHH